MRLKAKEIYGNITQGQGTLNPFSAGVVLDRNIACNSLFVRNILNQGSSNRNVHKTSLYIDLLMKML